MPTVFVTSASGNIGSALVPQLLQMQDAKLVLPTRDSQRLKSTVPASDRVIVVEGSVQDPRWVEEQFQTHLVDTVFLCLSEADEFITTLNILTAMQRSPSVKHLIYLSACADFAEVNAVGKWRMSAIGLVKMPVEQVLRDMDDRKFAYTVLGPGHFFENDLRLKDSIIGRGVYPAPVGNVGMALISTEDIAFAVVKSVEDRGRKYGGKKIMLGTRKWYKDADVERIWSEALGRPIKVTAHDEKALEQLETFMRGGVGPGYSRALRQMYEAFMDYGFGMSEDQYKEQVEFLGKEPGSYEDFVRRLASQWK